MCKQQFNSYIYDFHHKDPSKKDIGSAVLFNRSWKRIESQLNNLELLCSNCHRETHWNPDPLTGLHRSSSEEEEKSDSTIQMVTSVDRSLDHIGPGNDGCLAPGLSLDTTSPQNTQEG